MQNVAPDRRGKSISGLTSLATIYDAVQTPIIVLDASGRIVHFNKAVASLSTYKREDFEGKQLSETSLISESLKDLTTAHFEKRTHTSQFETTWPVVEGKQLTIQWQVSETTLENEDVIFVLTGQDITQQQAVEGRLSRSEVLYHELAKNFPNGAIIIFDHDLRYLLVEGSEVENVGLNPSLLLGKTLYEVFPQEVVGAIEPVMRATLSGQQFTAEAVYNGSPYDVRYLPLRDEEGNIIGGLSISQNITERKNIEDALRRSEALYRGIAQNFPNGAILLFDKDMRYQLVEGMEVKEVGLDRDKMVGRTLHEVFPPEVAQAIEPLFKTILAGKTVINESVYSDRTYQVHNLPIYDDKGEILAGLSISQNITERRNAEKNLETSLESEKKARREAQEAVRLKDMFLATMSHELRTPLNAMIGFMHLMIFSAQLNEDNTYMAERSIANSQRLLNLINNILDISRIASGGLHLVPVDMSPRTLAKTLHEDLTLLAKERNLELVYTVDDTLPETIRHDEERLSQIVLNLVGNAIKFTNEGSVKFNLSLKDTDKLVITVTDTGIGMPPSRQHVIFDDFVQLDNSSTRNHQGAGLGLSIVKRLTLLMKGSVSVSSEVGKGSEFIVEVPLVLDLSE